MNALSVEDMELKAKEELDDLYSVRIRGEWLEVEFRPETRDYVYRWCEIEVSREVAVSVFASREG
jgi:hypothetical protein